MTPPMRENIRTYNKKKKKKKTRNKNKKEREIEQRVYLLHTLSCDLAPYPL